MTTPVGLALAHLAQVAIAQATTVGVRQVLGINMSDDRVQIQVTVSGELATGKSTVLMLMAQYLNSIGYTVGLPTNLRGLQVNPELIDEEQCKNTIIKFKEVISE